MNPSSNQGVGVSPAEEQAGLPSLPELNPVPNTNPTAPITVGQPEPQSSQTSPIQISPTQLTAIPQAPTSINTTSGFQVADDKDVIEPEWVQKAKAIVSSTSDDPYKQSEDLTVLKADYMQKRYNKIVKLK